MTKGKKKRQAIMQYIRDYRAEQGYSPTLREIAKRVGLASQSTVFRYVQHLIAEGQLLTQETQTARGLIPADEMNRAHFDFEAVSNTVWQNQKLPRRQRVYAYIRMNIEHGYTPTIREIMAALHISSTSVVSWHLNKLQDAGYITRKRFKDRTIQLTEKGMKGL